MSERIDPSEAIEFIYINSKKYAAAKAERVYLEEFRKSKKALLMQQAAAEGFQSAAVQEREAYAHPDYQGLLQGLKKAVEDEEAIRWQLVAAQARIEVYRTQSANDRYVEKVTL
jgi:hypothetical protein